MSAVPISSSISVDPGVQAKYLGELAAKTQDRQAALTAAQDQLAIAQLEITAMTGMSPDVAAVLQGSGDLTSGADIARLKGDVARLQTEIAALATYTQAVQAIPVAPTDSAAAAATLLQAS